MNIRHVWGPDNTVVDAVSRIGANALFSNTPHYQFPSHGQGTSGRLTIHSVTICTTLIPFPESNPPGHDWQHNPVWCVHQNPSPIGPSELVPHHVWLPPCIATPRNTATQSLLTARYVCPGINIPVDVQKWALTCLQCQQSKCSATQLLPHVPLLQLLTYDLTKSIQTSLDHCPPRKARPTSHVQVHILVRGHSIADITVRGWIARFGIPSSVTTDHGRPFELNLWEKLMLLLESKYFWTNTYRPISNGLIEGFHSQLKVALQAKPDPTQWTETLPMALFGIHTALQKLHQHLLVIRNF